MMVLPAFYFRNWAAVNFGSLQLQLDLMSTFYLGLLVAQKSPSFLCQEYYFLYFFLNKRSIEISISFCERVYGIQFL